MTDLFFTHPLGLLPIYGRRRLLLRKRESSRLRRRSPERNCGLRVRPQAVLHAPRYDLAWKICEITPLRRIARAGRIKRGCLVTVGASVKLEIPFRGQPLEAASRILMVKQPTAPMDRQQAQLMRNGVNPRYIRAREFNRSELRKR